VAFLPGDPTPRWWGISAGEAACHRYVLMYATAAVTRSARGSERRIIRSSMTQMIRWASRIRQGPRNTAMTAQAGSDEPRVVRIPDMGTARSTQETPKWFYSIRLSSASVGLTEYDKFGQQGGAVLWGGYASRRLRRVLPGTSC